MTGSNVDVVELRFKVKTSVSAGIHSDVLNFTITQMVNEFSVAFANDVTGQVNDEQGGAQTLGQITVRNDAAYVGLFAYASVNELANLAPLSGASASSDVKTYVVYDDADEGNDDVSSLTSCSFIDAATAAAVVSLTSSNGCTVMTSSDHTTGAAAVGVSISLGGLTTSATFRVWFPATVALDVSDDVLGIVMPSDELLGASSKLQRAVRLNDTCSMRYQKAELRAYATFSAGDASVSSVDVTDLVGFASSNTAVAALDTSTSSAPVLQGLAPGATEVSVMLSKAESVSMTDATLEVQVSQDVPAVVEELTVVVYTGMTWSESVGSVALGGEGSAGVTLKHELSAEGHTASVAVYANFDDGTYEDVTSEASLVSLRPSSFGVVVDDDDGSKGIVVEVGAAKVCAPALEASLSVCGVSIGEGRGVVMLDMPDAVSVTLTPSSSKIAKSGDGATLAPFSIRTSVSFVVTMRFDDESSKDFTSDSRTSIVVVSDGSETMVDLDEDGILTVLPVATITAETSLTTVSVSFPDSSFTVSDTASVRVVELASLTVGSQPYPAVGGFSGDVYELKRISCSGVYQRLEATATGELSDGTQKSDFDFYKRVSFVSSNTGVADFTSEPEWGGNNRGLVATNAGQTSITGSFGGLSASMAITVEDSQVPITGLAIANDIGSSGTLKGVVGTTDNIKVTASFQDGTSIAISSSGQTSSSWISPSSLLRFSSAVETAVTVSSEGMVELQGNYHDAVELSVVDVCGSGMMASRDIYVKLEAEYQNEKMYGWRSFKSSALHKELDDGSSLPIPMYFSLDQYLNTSGDEIMINLGESSLESMLLEAGGANFSSIRNIAVEPSMTFPNKPCDSSAGEIIAGNPILIVTVRVSISLVARYVSNNIITTFSDYVLC